MIDNTANGTTRREERLNEVLLAYVEAAQEGRPPDRRRLIAANPDLRQELEEFFDSQDEVARLMEPLREVGSGGPSGSRADRSEDQTEDITATGKPPLGQLGDFRLLREVGRGGMGVVYEAEQISLRRRVALKILPFASAIDPRQLQRFQNEALAAAHLRHENIVPVYAVGNERGVHYYAMQFIDGRSLADLIDEMRPATEDFGEGVEASPTQRARASTGRINRDPTRQPSSKPVGADSLIASISRDRTNDRRRYFDWLAGLGRQAAIALEHAHQAGIVHRDIKPANLLLDARGQLWVADFGLAQFSSNSSVTVTGEVLGTLRYASPEQALGKRGLLDHRCDIYSLGASLYELLTMQPIFDGRDRQELLRQIALEEPSAPRTIDRSIPEELETIVLKAVSKEPADRYTSAQALADDLQSFLEDRPISARRPTLVERATRWTRRHRSLMAAGLFGLVLTIAGLSVAVVLAARAYDSERLRATEAEDRFRLARSLADEMIQIANQEASDNPDQQLVRKRMLEVAVDYYQQFINMRSGDATAQADLKKTQSQVEGFLTDLAVIRQAQRHMLLRRPEVRDDLKLTEDQGRELESLFDDITSRESRFDGQVRRIIDRKEMVEEMKAHEKGLARILTEKQQARLRQIGYQTRGLHVFEEPEVIAALALTQEQRTRLKDVARHVPRGPRGGGGRNMRPPPEWERGGLPPDGLPPGGREEDGPPFRRGPPIDREPDWSSALSILEPKQRERWNELAGPQFNFRPQGMWGKRPGSFDH
jgi:serine/threonine protein kinase